jgi:hypothetical protein
MSFFSMMPFKLVLGEHTVTDSDGNTTKEQITLGLNGIMEKKDIEFPNFPYNDLNMPSDSAIINLFYKVKRYGKKEGRNISEYSPKWDGFNDYNHVHVKGEFKRKVVKQAYLQHENERFYLHTPYFIDSDEVMADLRKNLGAVVEDGTDPQTQLPMFKEVMSVKKADRLIKRMYKEVRKHVEANTIDYDTMKVPQDFIDSRKRNRLSVEILKTEIPFTTDTYDKRSSSRVSLKLFSEFKGKIFYTTMSERHYHQNVSALHSQLFGNTWICQKRIKWDDKKRKYINHLSSSSHSNKINTGILFVRTAENNIKYFEMLDNAYTMDKYIPMMAQRKLKYVPMARKANNFVEQWEDVSSVYKSTGFDLVNKNIAEKVERVRNVVETCKKYGHYRYVNLNFLKESKYVNNEELEAAENVEMDEQETLNYLLELTEKNKNKLYFIDVPHTISPNEYNKHSELIDILQIVIDE